MAFSLFDATVKNFAQVLGATEGVLAKGRQHAEEHGKNLDDIVESKLIDDMLPFRFQVVSTAHHSMGALNAAVSGEFSPPSPKDEDYAALEQLIKDARAAVEGYSEDQVNGFVGNDIIFKIGGREIPFTAEDFLMSFSLPNFYFHATTTYDLLRQGGAPLGKMDFLGRMRMKG